MDIKLMMTLQEYLERKPIYGFRIPAAFEQILGITAEEYFESGMLAVQRLIDTFMQNYLSKHSWSFDGLDGKLIQRLKDILFAQFEYMDANQIWMQKSNDIQYSTAGQQTFTFNTNIDDSNFSLIPPNIKLMIKNTGLLNSIVGTTRDESLGTQYENEFLDGYFVNKVRWGDKANNIIIFRGNNFSVAQAIDWLNANSVMYQNEDYQKLESFIRSWKFKTERYILNSKMISYDTFYSGKEDNDLAQIKDVKDTWNATQQIVDNNSKRISQAVSLIAALEGSKVGNDTLALKLAEKANTSLSNVKMPESPVTKYLIANPDGSIGLRTSNELTVVKWEPTDKYVEGQFVYILNSSTSVEKVVLIFMATDKADNINKNPLESVNNGYWYKYDIEFSISGAATQDWVTDNFLNLSAPKTMMNNIDMGNKEIRNCSNILEKSSISDELIGKSTLWSSEKIKAEDNKVLEIIRDLAVKTERCLKMMTYTGDLLITADGSVHVIAEMFPENVQEIPNFDIVNRPPVDITGNETWTGEYRNGKKLYAKYVEGSLKAGKVTLFLTEPGYHLIKYEFQSDNFNNGSKEINVWPFYWENARYTYIKLSQSTDSRIYINKDWAFPCNYTGTFFYTKNEEPQTITESKPKYRAWEIIKPIDLLRDVNDEVITKLFAKN